MPSSANPISERGALAEEALRQGNPQAALELLVPIVRAHPADPKLRVFLAQLLCVLGRWERAHTQLNVVAEMDPLAIPMREMVGHAIRCELIRAQVFAGKCSPTVFGEPDKWLALLIESLAQGAQGQQSLASDLAHQAFDGAPESSGRLDDQPFNWIADADSRLGPVLEAFISGRYYWVPFSRLSRVQFEAPADLRDCVWMPAYLTFTNGGETVSLIPTRYIGSEASEDGLITLSRKTEWRDAGDDRWLGLGQRLLVTDHGEHALLTLRRIEFDGNPKNPLPSARSNGGL